MDSHSHQRPDRSDRQSFPWRTLWKWICVGSLLLGTTLAFAYHHSILAVESNKLSDLTIIGRGVFAFFELSLWTLAGVSAIGFIVSRKPNSDFEDMNM